VATFVLVHGAWSGGWYWGRVARRLRELGHDVYTPTLTGLGERSHLFAHDIGLSTHVRDVVNLLTFEDLRDVALVGHSYSGMVITGVADRVGARLAHLIYVDAFLPRDGQSMLDCTVGMANEVVDTVPETATQFGLLTPGDLAWIIPRLGVQPRRTFNDRIRLTGRHDPATRRAFVQTSEGFEDFARRARADGYTMRTYLEANHNPMITRPAELTTILDGLVREPAADGTATGDPAGVPYGREDALHDARVTWGAGAGHPAAPARGGAGRGPVRRWRDVPGVGILRRGPRTD
jgi:pimeloyl-ACP methyl ester carboxylesterase